MATKPVIAMAIGDPAAVSPELAARALASDAARKATMLVFGDRRTLVLGGEHAGVEIDLPVVSVGDI